MIPACAEELGGCRISVLCLRGSLQAPETQSPVGFGQDNRIPSCSSSLRRYIHRKPHRHDGSNAQALQVAVLTMQNRAIASRPSMPHERLKLIQQLCHAPRLLPDTTCCTVRVPCYYFELQGEGHLQALQEFLGADYTVEDCCRFVERELQRLDWSGTAQELDIFSAKTLPGGEDEEENKAESAHASHNSTHTHTKKKNTHTHTHTHGRLD